MINYVSRLMFKLIDHFFLLQLEFFTTFKAKYLEAKIQFVPKVEALVCASTQNLEHLLLSLP